MLVRRSGSNEPESLKYLKNILPLLFRNTRCLAFDRSERPFTDTMLNVRNALKALHGNDGFEIYLDWLSQDPEVLLSIGGKRGIHESWQRNSGPAYTAEEARTKLAKLAEASLDWVDYTTNEERQKREAEEWQKFQEWSAANPEPLVYDEEGNLREELIAWEPFNTSAAEFIDQDEEPQQFIIERWVPEGYVAAFSGDAGIGKTTTLIHALTCVAAGKPFFGCSVVQGDVLAILSENTMGQVSRFIRRSCEVIDADVRQTARRIFIESTINKSAVLWTEKKSADGKNETALGEQLIRTLRERPGIKFVLLDSAIDVYQGNMIDPQAVNPFLTWLTAIASQFKVGIALICHEAKSAGENDSHAISGAMTWRYKAKSQGRFEKDGKRTILKHTKHSFSPQAETLVLEYQDGIFVAVNRDAVRLHAGMGKALEILRWTTAAGKKLSPSKKANNYAARFMVENQGPEDFTVPEFEEALGALLMTQIRISTYLSSGKEHQCYEICEAAVGEN